MDCPGCARTIERTLAALAGVSGVTINVAAGTLRLELQPQRTSRDTVAAAVRRLGYGVEDGSGAAPPSVWRHRDVTLALVSALWIGLAQVSGHPNPCYALAIVIAGLTPLRRAWGALCSRQLDMNVLMMLAVAGAAALGDWAEAATVTFLFALGEMLEGYAARRSQRALEALVKERPELARVVRAGATVEVPAREVAVGELVEVLPGDRVSLDGEVVSGHSALDLSALTGESLPVEVGPGAEVLAGSLNYQGLLRFRVTRAFADSTLSRIIDMVQDAQARKATRQRFIDRFAQIYTPAVVGLAALLAASGPYVFGGSVADWVYRALVLLVIACPCALVISTPVTLVSALTGATRQGVLIKGGLFLERLARLKVVAFDKTGTLTRGQLQLVAFDGDSLELAAAVGQHSEHPLARATVTRARELGLTIPEATEFRAYPGVGTQARVGTQLVEVGRPQGPVPAGSGTVAEVRVDGERRALLRFSDRVRPEAKAAVSELHLLGLRTVMLTGDRLEAAEPVARELGLSEFHADLLPGDKLTRLEGYQIEGMVAMVGDGINDAPALAGADVGVAMGAAGTAVAVETADVALMGSDLHALARAVRVARRAEAVLTQNIVFAVGVKVIFFILAAAGMANMWMAILADTGAALVVTCNGLRLVGRSSRPSAPVAPAPATTSCCTSGCCGGS